MLFCIVVFKPLFFYFLLFCPVAAYQHTTLVLTAHPPRSALHLFHLSSSEQAGTCRDATRYTRDPPTDTVRPVHPSVSASASVQSKMDKTVQIRNKALGFVDDLYVFLFFFFVDSTIPWWKNNKCRPWSKFRCCLLHRSGVLRNVSCWVCMLAI